MLQIILVAAIAALAAGTESGASAAGDDKAASANAAAQTPAPVAWSINGTSWEFAMDGMTMQESIDAGGNYVLNSGNQHIDHGTVAMKDGKACFTSAMTNEGETCWTVTPVEIGASGEVVSDKGQKLTVKRVAYAPLTM